MYSFTSNIRFSEVNADKTLTLTSLVNYFQDCTIFHSESLHAGFEFLEPLHKAWVLSAWQVVIHRLPTFGESVLVGTWPYHFTTLSGERNFILKDASGEDLVTANSIWVFTDTQTGRPARLAPEYAGMYPLDPPYPMDYAPRKIALPEQYQEEASFSVTKHHLDSNHHVNNAQYIRMAEDYLPDGFQVGEFRADYRKSARLHDEIHPLVTVTGNDCTVVLADKDNKPYTTVQFIRKEN
ncbi:MAG: acyl-[acyl-carrier-protein] thioesterase [Lachnospiraceae bacterium]|nr:acyl-[acyl-carrier-protein] thioesterase [Lachnospiraceae bacterium]